MKRLRAKDEPRERSRAESLRSDSVAFLVRWEEEEEGGGHSLFMDIKDPCWRRHQKCGMDQGTGVADKRNDGLGNQRQGGGT